MTHNGEAPKEHTLDSSLALLADGYEFIQKRCREFNSEIFQTRLLGKKAVCISGKEAAELFYDNDKFQRGGAIPKRIQKSLFGENAIQTLDGEAHRHRKAAFLSLMTPPRLKQLAELTLEEWRAAAARWEGRVRIVLLEESQEVLCRAACRWAGVPLADEEARERADDFGAMVEAFGAVGPKHGEGRRARKKAEAWIEGLITEIREGKRVVPEDTAAYVMAYHRDHEGLPLDPRMAAIELINVVRPIVAIGRYVVFSAVALYDYPQYRQKVVQGDDTCVQWFVQEVRRFYPFTPFLGAAVRREFTWKGQTFEEGTMVLLDVYGTTHSPALWEQPDEFRPERFRDWDGSPFDLIPQGGGDHRTNHRCAGEWLTIDLMKVSLRFLTRELSYDVPEQDMHISLSKMPALPGDGFLMCNTRLTGEPALRKG